MVGFISLILFPTAIDPKAVLPFQVEQVERGLRQAELEGKRKTEEVQAVKNKVGCLVGWSRLSRTRLVVVSILCCFDLAGMVVCSLEYPPIAPCLFFGCLLVCETAPIESD